LFGFSPELHNVQRRSYRRLRIYRPKRNNFYVFPASLLYVVSEMERSKNLQIQNVCSLKKLPYVGQSKMKQSLSYLFLLPVFPPPLSSFSSYFESFAENVCNLYERREIKWILCVSVMTQQHVKTRLVYQCLR